MVLLTNIGLTLGGFLFLLFIIIGYIKSQKAKTFSNILFILLLITTILIAITDISFVFIANHVNNLILTILCDTYMFFAMLWINTLSLYIITIANRDAFNNRKYLRVTGTIVLTIVTILGFILSLVFHLIPSIDASKELTNIIGAIGMPLYIPGAILLGTIIYLFISVYNRMDKLTKIPFYSSIALLIIEVLTTIFKLNFNELVFLFEIVTIIIYLTSESVNVKMIKEITVSKAESEVTLGGQNEFISSMSHDIRTPLGAIIGYTDILLNDKELNLEKAKEELSNISEASEKLNDLMSNLMDLSILNEGKETIIKDTYNVQKIASDVENKLSSKIQRKGNTYSYLISERLPVNLNCDGEKLSRIFELLLNIINSHTEGGSITVNYSGEINEEKYVIKGTIEAYNNSLTQEDFNLTFTKYMELYTDEINAIDSENLGLIIAKNYIELLDGTYEYMIDDTGKTTCNISIPVEFSQGDAE